MKGIVNLGIQEFVIARWGEEKWSAVKERAGCEAPFFAIAQDYPDEMSAALVEAAAEELGISANDAWTECGTFIVPNTLKANYPSYMALAGSSAREFLLNMGRIHEQVTRSVANAKPPSFRYEEPEDGRLLMHYESGRGLCALFRGLILGVGILFGQELRVDERSCVRRGDPDCTMEITFL